MDMARLTELSRSLEGARVVVTGAASGMGRSTAHLFADEGARVLVADWNPEEVASVVEEIRGVHGRDAVSGVSGDVSLPSDRQAIIQGCVDAFGGMDVLVNNAGITRDGTLLKMTYEMWDEVMRINLGGCFNMAKAVFPGMRERGWGRIVNIGSINGQGGQYGQVNYAAAKSGIHGFTKALAQEGAKFGVTVNALAPGYIDTDMVAAVPEDVLAKIVAKVPVGRLGQADEIARGVAFLCGEDAGFVTGSTLSINGGQHMY